ncbi:MAG: RidA family protein [Myxococcales bacterium]|nr:RidA family protein [Myxococcales bacterium]MDH3844430.1 RidA family protein [Myxococcales bacterium]
MPNKRIETEGAPAAVGPYSQAVSAGGWLFCSGQIALDPLSGMLVGDGDVEVETRQVLRNLDAVLLQAGASRADVVKATVYLADMNEFSKMNEIYAEYFEGSAPPARACVEAAALPRGVKVEIDFIAHVAR